MAEALSHIEGTELGAKENYARRQILSADTVTHCVAIPTGLIFFALLCCFGSSRLTTSANHEGRSECYCRNYLLHCGAFLSVDEISISEWGDRGFAFG